MGASFVLTGFVLLRNTSFLSHDSTYVLVVEVPFGALGWVTCLVCALNYSAHPLLLHNSNAPLPIGAQSIVQSRRDSEKSTAID